MRCVMPGGIAATEQAREVCKIQKNKRIFPLLRELGPLLAEHCGGGAAVLKMNHMRLEKGRERLENTVGLYLPNEADESIQQTRWWADNKFRTRGLMYIFPMKYGMTTQDFGNKTVILHEEIIHGPIGRCVAWYLMLSYLYYKCHESVVPDPVFDMLCVRLLNNYDEASKHMHAHLFDEELLRAGTAYTIREEQYPGMCKSAAHTIADIGRTVIG